MLNPMKLMGMKKDYEEFAGRHPRFVQFVMALMQSNIGAGSVIDITVTTPDGKNYQSNMRLTEEDIEFVKSFKDLM